MIGIFYYRLLMGRADIIFCILLPQNTKGFSMPKQDRVEQVQEKIQQVLEKLGAALDQWINKNGLKPQPIPIPLDRRYRRRTK